LPRLWSLSLNILDNVGDVDKTLFSERIFVTWYGIQVLLKGDLLSEIFTNILHTCGTLLSNYVESFLTKQAILDITLIEIKKKTNC
jgi:hypothetical protein